MDIPIENRSPGKLTIILSVFAGLMWLGVLGLLAKWFKVWFEGRLAPGESTSWFALIALFTFAVLVSIAGIFAAVRAWRGRLQLKWQIASLLGAVLTLWAVSGD